MADVSAETSVVPTDSLVNGARTRIMQCHDVFTQLTGRWRDLFKVSFEVPLYDLTSTYFGSDPPLDEDDKRCHGYSRDHRFDCVQIVSR